MLRFIIKIVIFSTLSVILLLGFIDDRFKRPTSFQSSMNSFNRTNKDSLSLIIMGSSHAAQSYIPLIIDKSLNIKSHNFGSGGQRLMVTNALLKDILKETTPKVLILDVFWGSFDFPDSDEEKGLQLRTIDNIIISSNKFSLVNNIYSNKELPSVLSATIRNHKNWYKINDSSNKLRTRENSELWSKGYTGSYNTLNKKQRKELEGLDKKVEAFLKAQNVFEKKARTVFNFDELKKTIDICKKNNIELIVVSAPYFGVFEGSTSKNFYIALQNFCDNYKVDYINYNFKFRELGFDFDDYRDKGHLNIYGADKATNYLVNYLLEKKYFKIDPSISIDNILDKVSFQFKTIYELEVENELFPNILVSKVLIEKNNKYYQVKLEVNKGSEMNKFLKNYRLECVANVYKKDLLLLKGKFEGKKSEYYGYNPKIVSNNDMNFIYFRLPITSITEYRKIRIYSFKKKEKKSTQIEGIIFEDVKLNLTKIKKLKLFQEQLIK